MMTTARIAIMTNGCANARLSIIGGSAMALLIVLVGWVQATGAARPIAGHQRWLAASFAGSGASTVSTGKTVAVLGRGRTSGVSFEGSPRTVRWTTRRTTSKEGPAKSVTRRRAAHPLLSFRSVSSQ